MPANLVFSIITIIFSLFFLYHALQLPPSRSPASLGPAFWPTAVLIVMLIMGVLLLIRTLVEMRQSKSAAHAVAEENPAAELEELGVNVPEEEEVKPSKEFRHRQWVMVALLMVYFLIMNHVGFLVSTILFLAASTWLLGLRRIIPLALTSVLSSFVIIYLFSTILSVPLPRGVGVFRTISQLFG